MQNESLSVLLDRYLSKFDSIIDFEHLKNIEQAHRDIYEFKEVDEIPFVLADVSHASDNDWQEFPYNDAFVDPAKMLLNELRDPFLHHQLKDYRPVNLRCNYGTVIMPSLFGVPYRLTETSLPWADHLGSRNDIRALIDRGIPDIKSGLGARIFETADYYCDVLAGYSNLGRAAEIYHPDFQGPFDSAHLIWGPDIFVALFDCPNLVHELLSLITKTYSEVMREWKRCNREGNEFNTHWDFYMKGGILLRDDTPVLLSSGQYEEFVKPYDQMLLDEFTGGIHFCGRGDHFIPSMCESRNMYTLHVAQPELNDMNSLWESVRRNNLVLHGLGEQYVPEGTKTGVIINRGYRPVGETVLRR